LAVVVVGRRARGREIADEAHEIAGPAYERARDQDLLGARLQLQAVVVIRGDRSDRRDGGDERRREPHAEPRGPGLARVGVTDARPDE